MDTPKFGQVSKRTASWMNRRSLTFNLRIRNCLLLQGARTKFIGRFENCRQRGLAGEIKRINASSDEGEIFVGRKFCQIPLMPLAVVI